MTHTVTPFAQGDVQTFVELLCDGYRVEGMTSVQALLDLLTEKSALHPGFRLFATLDDFGQASYTSGHATDMHQLDDTDGYDLTGVDPGAFEDGEHVGYLSTKSEFFVRYGNLAKAAASRPFPRGVLPWGIGEDRFDFFALNADPNRVDKREIIVQIVPVEHAFEAICAFPNGYFVNDLTPMDVWAMARHFEMEYGYCLFGIGASYVGLRRSFILSPVQIDRLAADVLSLFDGADTTALVKVAEVIRGSEYILINYNGG